MTGTLRTGNHTEGSAVPLHVEDVFEHLRSTRSGVMLYINRASMVSKLAVFRLPAGLHLFVGGLGIGLTDGRIGKIVAIERCWTVLRGGVVKMARKDRRVEVARRQRRQRVFLMDLLATVPYYTAYLAKALLKENAVNLTVGSIDYYLDSECFLSRGIVVDPGLLNVVGGYRLPRSPRRVLKLAEAVVNLLGLTVRFLLSPPDVIHVQFLPMLQSHLPLDFWFIEICRRRGAKIVLTVHDLLPHDTGEVRISSYVHLYGRVDALICHSDSVRAQMMAEFRVPEAKVRVIPHGPFFYDLPTTGSDEVLRDFGLKTSGSLVLWQGIIFPYKGVDLLLRAWRRVETVCPDASLVIAGTGAPEMLEQIREQVEALDLGRVKLIFRFLSPEELVALYRAAAVVVYPYRAITTSGALATGMALGKAIVATDLPVFREQLRDGENARLVPALDADALAEALAELLQDRVKRERLAEAVRAMQFGDGVWESIARETVRVYGQIAANGTHRAGI